MNACDLNDLRSVCAKFRAAIERCDRSRLPIQFDRFPAGACGDASLILGHHLGRLGYRDLDYILGSRGVGADSGGHAWLQIGGIVIDITADQFPEIDRKVIVEPNSTWHTALNGGRVHAGDYNVFVHDPPTFGMLSATYSWVLEVMRQVGDTELNHERR